MKLSKLFLSIAIPVILVFTMLISPAMSYQQSMTETSENVYTLGDIDITFNVPQLNHMNHTKIYPTDFIPAEPLIQNIGNNPAWIILAVKIPSENAPFNSFIDINKSSTDIDFVLNNFNTDRQYYYSSFSTYYPSSARAENQRRYSLYHYFDGNFSTTKENIEAALTSETPFDLNGLNGYNENDESLCSNRNAKWKKLGVNADYANEENGFFIYYFGYIEPLNPQEITDKPFFGFMANNLQDIYYDKTNTNAPYSDALIKSPHKVEIDRLNQNLGIEMRALAIQDSLNTDEPTIESAWNTFKTNPDYTIFGKESIAHITSDKEYTRDTHTLNGVITKDVKRIKIENETTHNVQICDVENNKLHKNTTDANGLTRISLDVNFQDSGKYVLSVSTNDNPNDFTNPVSIGEITVK